MYFSAKETYKSFDCCCVMIKTPNYRHDEKNFLFVYSLCFSLPLAMKYTTPKLAEDVLHKVIDVGIPAERFANGQTCNFK